MKWRDYLCFASLAFLSLFVGSVIINQKNNVSALSDIVVSFDRDHTTVQTLCAPGDCSGYNYLVISSSGSIPYNFSAVFQIQDNNFDSGSFSIPFVSFDSSGSIILSLTDVRRIYNVSVSNVANLPSGLSITYTLTDTFPSSSDPCPDSPSGSLSITSNGTYDVTNYAEAVVDVPPEIIQGDYHDDLVSLKKAIVIVPAVALVIYFLYAIYKMLLGGKTL